MDREGRKGEGQERGIPALVNLYLLWRKTHPCLREYGREATSPHPSPSPWNKSFRRERRRRKRQWEEEKGKLHSHRGGGLLGLETPLRLAPEEAGVVIAGRRLYCAVPLFIPFPPLPVAGWTEDTAVAGLVVEGEKTYLPFSGGFCGGKLRKLEA